MYYEETWIDGKLFWRGTPRGKWIEADSAKLNRALKEAQAELRLLRNLAHSAKCRLDELEQEMTTGSWRTATERRALITRDHLKAALDG